MRNKKAEGSISSLVITVILAISSLVLVANLVTNMVGSYGVESAPEFTQYKALEADLKENVTEDIVKSQDNFDDEGLRTDPIKRVFQNIENAWQDSIFGKAWSTIKLIPRVMKFTTNSISGSLTQIGFNLPDTFIWLIITIASVTIVFLMVKAIWEKRT